MLVQEMADMLFHLGMGTQTLSLPSPSHWYWQSSLYCVVHSVSVYGSYSVEYWSTHTFLYTV